MALKVGELFVKRGVLTPEQLDAALVDQARTGKFLGEILMELGYISEEQLLTILAEQFHTRFVDLDDVHVNPVVLKMVPRELAWEHRFLPIEMRSGVMMIAVSNPLDMWPMSVLQEQIHVTEVQIVLAPKGAIEKSIWRHYGPGEGS